MEVMDALAVAFYTQYDLGEIFWSSTNTVVTGTEAGNAGLRETQTQTGRESRVSRESVRHVGALTLRECSNSKLASFFLGSSFFG